MRRMRQPINTAADPVAEREPGGDDAWNTVQAAAAHAERLAQTTQFAAFALASGQQLRAVATADADAVIAWRPGIGWELVLPPDDPRYALIDLYLPICAATTLRPLTVGHLGQSLDGFIATHGGESRFVT